MSMTIVVTRNAPDRYRGFLASVMLEVAPGTYVSPSMSQGVRQRVWQVCLDWAVALPTEACVTMIWRESTAPGSLGIESVGAPRIALVQHDGLWLDHQELTAAHVDLLRAPAPPSAQVEKPPESLSDK